MGRGQTSRKAAHVWNLLAFFFSFFFTDLNQQYLLAGCSLVVGAMKSGSTGGKKNPNKTKFGLNLNCGTVQLDLLSIRQRPLASFTIVVVGSNAGHRAESSYSVQPVIMPNAFHM